MPRPMNGIFKSSTALVMSIALISSQALSGPAAAQGMFDAKLDPALAAFIGAKDAPRVKGKLQLCALADPVPCILPDGSIAKDADSAKASTEDPKAVASAKLLEVKDRQARRAARAAAQEAEASAPKAAESAPEKPPAEKAASQPAPEHKEEAPKPEPGQSPFDKKKAPPKQAPAQPQAELAAPEPQAEQPAPEPQAEQPARAPKAEQPAPDRSPFDKKKAPPKQAPAQPQAEQPAPEPQAEQPAPAPKAEAPAPAPKAEEPASGRSPFDKKKAPPPKPEKAGETVEPRNDAGLTEEQAKAEARKQARAQEAAESVAAAEEANDPGAGKVIADTVVGKEDVRTSAEDFAPKEKKEQQAKADKKKGLSDFEKLALLGVGALVVGALLKNGDKVVSTSGDRAVVQRDDGSYYVLKNDDEILRQPGSNIETRQFRDGSTLTTVKRPDGTEVRTIRDAEGRVLRRTKVLVDGTSVTLFDDTEKVAPVDVAKLPKERAVDVDVSAGASSADLEAALRRKLDTGVDRRFSLGQIRNIRAVRELVPIIDLDQITFDTGSAAIRPEQADKLVDLGRAMQDLLARNPGEVFLIEGHTDAVGSAASNLALSDRRAESLALALTEYFDIPPENMVVQGYGESYLKVPVLDANRENRRVSVRDITPLLVASN